MKVAIATDDGKTVSQDLGSAKFYLVVTVSRSKTKGRELRLKARRVPSRWDDGEINPVRGVGSFIQPVEDCQLLIVGGMSRAEDQDFKRLGKATRLTDLALVEDILAALVRGRLDDHPERAR